MNKDEALRLALEALYGFIPYLPIGKDKAQCDKYNQAVYAIKAALEAKDEPVAWEQFHEHMAGPNYVAPQRTWVELTDEDIQKLAAEQHDWESLYLAVQAKLKEKNNV